MALVRILVMLVAALAAPGALAQTGQSLYFSYCQGCHSFAGNNHNGVLNGKGASLLDGYMEDLATDRIYRLMIAQRIRHREILEMEEASDQIRHTLETVNHFAAEMDHFSECILNNTEPLTPGEEGLKDHKVMAAIEEAARIGARVKV